MLLKKMLRGKHNGSDDLNKDHHCTHDDHHHHDHHHSHNHSHSHFEVKSDKDISTAFVIGGVLNFAFVIIEFAVGLMTGSVSLLADALHNFSDVIALFLSWFGFKMNKTKSSTNFTFGFKKSSVIISLFNSFTLLLSLGFVLYEAILRLINPQPIAENKVAIVAFIGVVINFSSAYLFRNNKSDINVKSAYLHLLIDALISLAVVVSAVLIKFTGWIILDPIMAIAIVIIIAKSTWLLLKESFVVTLGGVPPGVDTIKLRKVLLNHSLVKSIHDLHVWSVSSSETALMVHVVINANSFPGNSIYNELKSEINRYFKIQHITLQIELNESRDLFDCDLIEKC